MKEVIYIRVSHHSLIRDDRRYNLPIAWNNLLKTRVRGAGAKTRRATL